MVPKISGKAFWMLMSRAQLVIAVLATVAAAPMWAQNYVTGPNSGAESKIDNIPDIVTFPLTVTGGGTYSLSGGIFFLKGGTSTTGSIALSLMNGATTLAAVTLSNAQFCAGISNCQSYSYHTFTFPAAAVLSAGSYSLVLTSSATPQQNEAYFSKCAGTTITVSTNVVGVSDLVVTKSGSPNPFLQGSTATYAIQVANIGNLATSGTITVTEPLDANLSFLSASGSNWICGGAPALTCTSTTAVAAGGSAAPITVSALVLSNGEAAITNNVSVAGGGETNTANDTFQLVTPVTSPNLNVTKSATPTAFTPAGSAAYSIVVANSGNAATTGTVTVTDTLDANLTYVSASGSGWTCNPAGQVVTCTSTTAIAASGSAVITLNTTVKSNGEASVTNNVAVSGGGQASGLSSSFQLVTSVGAAVSPVPISNWPTLIGLAAAALFFFANRKSLRTA
jgi:uncharacterized repeat protein (TIGR01451 family)